MEAEIGHRPSYTWRSILGARKVVEAGSRWRIGDGSRVKIWTDRLIPTPVSFKTVSPRRSLPTSVGDLINEQSWSWNEQLVDDVFLPLEVLVIKSIPLSRNSLEDRLIWHYNQMVDSRFEAHTILLLIKSYCKMGQATHLLLQVLDN
ncbi:unnamed protein product [Ilex paraguariensis]|uniref:Uncharacterized protein n=1 Tax=Ilex paraguariensis TaxID=185542 RepID=A0ABC8TI47_9AQUA